MEAFEKNGKNESPDQAVCQGLEHWSGQESVLGVSVYACLVALEIKLQLYHEHAFFQINYF